MMMEFYVILLLVLPIYFAECKLEIVEGDIIMDRKLEIIRDAGKGDTTGHRLRRNILMKTKKVHEHRWKDGYIPYVISTDLGKYAKKAIKAAFKQIEKYTCIQFSPWNGEPDFIEFIKGEGCYSNIGRQKGRQIVSIGAGCEYKTTVIHELLHALGMFHEQSRLDRDLYVNVLWWNMQKGAEKNFDTYDHGVIDSLHFPYDYHSATHYFNKDFTRNGQDTLQAVAKPAKRLGNQFGMSKIDIKKIYKFYKCYKRKTRPKKVSCHDKMDWCPHYTRHCNTKWFAERYCQKSCGTCIE